MASYNLLDTHYMCATLCDITPSPHLKRLTRPRVGTERSDTGVRFIFHLTTWLSTSGSVRLYLSAICWRLKPQSLLTGEMVSTEDNQLLILLRVQDKKGPQL